MADPELRELMLQFRLAGLYGVPQRQDGRANTCWLSAQDGRQRACEGPIEAFHFIGRQRVRNALSALGFEPALIRLAEWDPRNAGPGCELHHRRLDSQAMPGLVVWREKLPINVEAFATDWGLEGQLDAKYPTMTAENLDRCPSCGMPLSDMDLQTAVPTDDGLMHVECEEDR